MSYPHRVITDMREACEETVLVHAAQHAGHLADATRHNGEREHARASRAVPHKAQQLLQRLDDLGALELRARVERVRTCARAVEEEQVEVVEEDEGGRGRAPHTLLVDEAQLLADRVRGLVHEALAVDVVVQGGRAQLVADGLDQGAFTLRKYEIKVGVNVREYT